MLRRAGSPGRLPLLAIAFGVVAAPKNSLWNYTPLLLSVFFCWPLVRRRSAAMAVLVTGLALIEIQAVVDYFRHSFYTSPGLTWLSSLALYGALLLIALNAYLVLQGRSPAGPGLREAASVRPPPRASPRRRLRPRHPEAPVAHLREGVAATGHPEVVGHHHHGAVLPVVRQ